MSCEYCNANLDGYDARDKLYTKRCAHDGHTAGKHAYHHPHGSVASSSFSCSGFELEKPVEELPECTESEALAALEALKELAS